MPLGVFQSNVFQGDVFQVDRSVTSTINLHKPVDCVLAGAVPLTDRVEMRSGRTRNPIGSSTLRGSALRHAFNE